MPYLRRRNETWMMELALATAGTEAMWPGMEPAWLECGQRQIDLDRTMSRIRSFKMISKEWERTAKDLDEQASIAEGKGDFVTAGEFYHRAAICFGRAKWPILDNTSERKLGLHAAEDRCFDKVISFNDLYKIKRIEIPFENASIPGILHLPNNTKQPPCVVFVPGMDMTKEDFPNVQNNVFTRRGLACLAIDGPGQGACNLRGIQSRPGAYERAMSAVLDALGKRSDIDGTNVSLLGLSLGGYYSVRCAAADPRFKAHVSMIGLYGDLDHFFTMAPPNFRHHFMYMAGVTTDEELDALVAELSLPRLAPRIKVPILMVTAEYDQLTPVEAAEAFFNQLECPKEMWIAERQFHPMGSLRANLWPEIADWIKMVVTHGIPPGYSSRRLIPES